MSIQEDLTQQTAEQFEANQGSKITFTAEQQRKLDEIIRERQGAAAREVRARASNLETENETLKAQLAELTEKLNSTPNLEQDLAEARENSKTLREQFHRYKKDTAIAALANSIKPMDAAIVGELMSKNLKIDDGGNLVAVTPEGHPMLDPDTMEPVTAEQFASTWAKAHPYLIQGPVKSGTGTAETQKLSFTPKYDLRQLFGRGSDGVMANQLAKRDKQLYQELKRKAQESGLI